LKQSRRYLYSLVARRIDEISSSIVVRIEELERLLLVHVAQKAAMLVADAHRAELQGRDVDASIRAELPVDCERGGGLGWGGEDVLTRHWEMLLEGQRDGI